MSSPDHQSIATPAPHPPADPQVTGSPPPAQPPTHAPVRVLAGDIGGTHARLAVVELAGPTARVVHAHRVRSHSVTGIAALVADFRATLDGGGEFDRACFAVAGAPIGDVWTTPNLPWAISTRTVARDVGIARSAVVNDFEAVGYALPWLRGGDLETLQAGVPVEHGPLALIGAGTGLGMGIVLWDGSRYRVYPSEGGHADLAPRSALECELLLWLQERHGRVSLERVLSGRGLESVYRFLAEREPEREHPAVREAMTRETPAAVITRHGGDGGDGDALCHEALTLFAGVYGAAAGNLALTILSTGGVFVGGGMAPRMLGALRHGGFLPAFGDKGRLRELVRRMPVHVITTGDAGLIGAAVVAAGL